MGYRRAFPDAEIVGVDIAPQRHYPFEFWHADALRVPLHWGFDLVHASPPCQHFTIYRNNVKDIKDRYEDLIAPTRAMLAASGAPYVIENVPGAPLVNPITLCGSMFGLDVRRHRLFETSFPMMSPPCNHGVWTERKYKGSSNRGKRFTIEVGAWNEKLELQKQCMGVDWPITLRELSEAIPPAYTQYVGEQFAASLQQAA